MRPGIPQHICWLERHRFCSLRVVELWQELCKSFQSPCNDAASLAECFRPNKWTSAFSTLSHGQSDSCSELRICSHLGTSAFADQHLTKWWRSWQSSKRTSASAVTWTPSEHLLRSYRTASPTPRPRPPRAGSCAKVSRNGTRPLEAQEPIRLKP